MDDLDTLIQFSLAAAEVDSGIPLDIVRARAGSLASRLSVSSWVLNKSPRWSAQEDAFLAANLGRMTLAEIGRVLGRTENAVKIHFTRGNFYAPSKHPDYLTANKAAWLLGVDAHKVTYWVDSGLLPGELLPGPRAIRRIRKTVFLRWMVNPMNWIWFNPSKVADFRIRRLLELKRRRWGDEWWDTNRVASYHGVDNKDVLRYIQHGRLRAVRATNRCGRDRGTWANWFMLRSEATRPGIVFYKGKGGARGKDCWSQRADAFLLKARDEWGLPWAAIGRMMKWPHQRVCYRYSQLHKQQQPL